MSKSTFFEKYRTPILGVFFTLIILGVLVALFNWLIMPFYTLHWSEKELPDVTEMTYEEAKKTLELKGFEIIFDGEKFNATYPESTVISQNPPPFTKIKKGRRIYVIISAGEKLYKVPKVIGSSERDAEFILKKNNLVLGEIFYEYNNYQPRGVVCGQSLDEGLEVRTETAVDIFVSNGRLPTRFFVPDVIGKSLDRAKQMIRYAGLYIGVIKYEILPSLLPDTVLRQSIDGDEEVRQGQTVNLVVSSLEEEGPLEEEGWEE